MIDGVPEIIFLCGFSGSGKTETGTILAGQFGFGFTDTDEAIEALFKKNIPEIFLKDGEKKFRTAEADVICQAVENKPRVISLGGGAIQSDNSLTYIKDRGSLIYLKATPETVYNRLQQSHRRPMLETLSKGKKDEKDAVMARIRSLMAERERFYLSADIVVDTESKSHHDVASEVRSKLGG